MTVHCYDFDDGVVGGGAGDGGGDDGDCDDDLGDCDSAQGI